MVAQPDPITPEAATQPDDFTLPGVVTQRGRRIRTKRTPAQSFSAKQALLRQSDVQRLKDLRHGLRLRGKEPSFTVLTRAAIAALHRDLLRLPATVLFGLLDEARKIDRT